MQQIAQLQRLVNQPAPQALAIKEARLEAFSNKFNTESIRSKLRSKPTIDYFVSWCWSKFFSRRAFLSAHYRRFVIDSFWLFFASFNWFIGTSMHALTRPGHQYLFKLAGFANVPKSASTFKKILLDQYGLAKKKIVDELKAYISRGLQISISTDDWTSISMHKYTNLIAHFGDKYYSIGLVRFKSNQTHYSIYKSKLEELGIDPSDVILHRPCTP